MSAHPEEDELKPSSTPATSPLPQSLPKSTPNSTQKTRAWLGGKHLWASSLVSGVPHLDPRLPLTLELDSPTLPAGKKIVFELSDPVKIAQLKNTPINIKEGVEYNVRIAFKVNHSIISGVRYLQVVKRSGITVDKLEQMLGSYGPNTKETPFYLKNFDSEESPSGMLARTGTYHVRSRVVDDDGEVYADWVWSFKLAKEW
ncbi:rho GDP-dissociation inhibitor [Ephemerocybe angulata]|uniref:Rho GDP-dissociation inhibitor n=1 Tax=Ephemerocybe angulata TaxID=980116 RepID=A0A8H6MFL4_9AGAR|nr:rho GDP-dissociation inhibitor [Tulosesus angulatus]